MPRVTFPPSNRGATESLSDPITLDAACGEVDIQFVVPTPDPTLAFTIALECLPAGSTRWRAYFTASGLADMHSSDGTVLPAYTWTYTLHSGPQRTRVFSDPLDQYRIRLTLSKPARVGLSIGGRTAEEL